MFTAGEPGAWNTLANRSLAPNTTYCETITGYEYMTDDHGRVTHAEGMLLDETGHRNTHQQRRAGHPHRLSTDDGGHYFATVFRGPGEAINLTPMDANLNRGAWKRMENLWVDALKRGKEVRVTIDVAYDGTSRRPDRFEVRYMISGERLRREAFKNRPGGT